MYCERCDEHHFGGGICPSCAGRLRRGEATFSPHGTPLLQKPNIGVYGKSEGRGGPAGKNETTGQSAGFLMRLCYKILESAFACALFSVTLRIVIFFVKVIDSMMETGGDVKEGISLYSDMRMAISGYEMAAWLLIAVLIFRCRHRPN